MAIDFNSALFARKLPHFPLSAGLANPPQGRLTVGAVRHDIWHCALRIATRMVIKIPGIEGKSWMQLPSVVLFHFTIEFKSPFTLIAHPHFSLYFITFLAILGGTVA